MNRYVLIVLLLVSFSGISQNQRMPAQGKVHVFSIKSTVLNVERNYSVYLPKSYEQDQTRSYPVLYLLHGLGDTNKGWTERGHLQDVANQVINSEQAKEMIIVTPDAGSVFNGYFDMEGWSYEKFFFEEFLPFIEKTYRIRGDKANRAIAGLSMGGGGATAYAQKHPELFSSVYAMSALMNIPSGRPPQANPDPKMEALNKSVIKNSCVSFVENADEAQKEQLKSVRWFVDCGDDDFLLDANIDFLRAMRKAGIPLQFRIRDGGHTWEYWNSALYSALRNASLTFDKP